MRIEILAHELLDFLSEEATGWGTPSDTPVLISFSVDRPASVLVADLARVCTELLATPWNASLPNDYGGTGGLPIVIATGAITPFAVVHLFLETTTDPHGWLAYEVVGPQNRGLALGGFSLSIAVP